MPIALLAKAVNALGLVLLAGAQILGRFAASSAETPSAFWSMASFSRWPLAVLILLLQATLVYRLTLYQKTPAGTIVPGVTAFALGWIIASSVFAFYVDFIGSYAAIFGVLGGVMAILVWFQLTASALLVGAELNATLAD